MNRASAEMLGAGAMDGGSMLQQVSAIDVERELFCAADVLGVITKDHVADSVSASVQTYPGEH